MRPSKQWGFRCAPTTSSGSGSRYSGQVQRGCCGESTSASTSFRMGMCWMRVPLHKHWASPPAMMRAPSLLGRCRDCNRSVSHMAAPTQSQCVACYRLLHSDISAACQRRCATHTRSGFTPAHWRPDIITLSARRSGRLQCLGQLVFAASCQKIHVIRHIGMRLDQRRSAHDEFIAYITHQEVRQRLHRVSRVKH